MKQLDVQLDHRTYSIQIGDNALSLLQTLKPLQEASNLVLITNHTVYALYGERTLALMHTLNKPCISIILPDGEVYKTIEHLNDIYTALLQARCDRKSLIIALGGGVIGDMAGFAASTYMRGIPFVQVPTTLLAQVDSSVGGKTAVNHPLGKNMIGAFYQPQAVLADSSILSTLEPREISAGIAEIIKYGCMADTAFFEWLEHNIYRLNALDSEAIIYAVEQSCAIKANIVAQDETESSTLNMRALLNFGHTFGHTFEMILGYGTWLHGEAVGYGMICAAVLSKELGFLSDNAVLRIKQLVKAAHLPTQWPVQVSSEAVLAAMSIDKKIEYGVLKFIILDSIGSARVCSVETSQVIRCIELLQNSEYI